MTRWSSRPRVVRVVLTAAIVVVGTLGSLWETCRQRSGTLEKRVRVVVPGRLWRGAWQTPAALRRLIARERIKTVVTLTAINRDDPKYVSQAEVVRATGVDWILIPMRGSHATLEQMVQAADVLADPQRQPVFFHCVAGHHRTNLTHAAYLIRHADSSAAQAWSTLAALPWTRPEAPADQRDRTLIEEFARRQSSWPTLRDRSTR
jgi:protein tyrosine phosphatase (PTP) superfamily phosphohydrolase (DUF442 family)